MFLSNWVNLEKYFLQSFFKKGSFHYNLSWLFLFQLAAKYNNSGPWSDVEITSGEDMQYTEDGACWINLGGNMKVQPSLIQYYTWLPWHHISTTDDILSHLSSKQFIASFIESILFLCGGVSLREIECLAQDYLYVS